MKEALCVFLGGGMGALLRYVTVLGMASAGISRSFPWSILVANVLGSFALGYLIAAPALRDRDSLWWLFLATGTLGGFTTFSTLSADTLTLLQTGRVLAALGNSLGSLILGLLAAAAGYKCAQIIHSHG